MKAASIVLTCLFTALEFPSIASARLGETQAQSEQRYGKPIQLMTTNQFALLDDAVNRSYEYQGWRIDTAFMDDKAVMVRYTKLPKPGGAFSITDDEAKAILDAEAAGGQWKLTRTLNFIDASIHPKRWTNSNGNIAYVTGGAPLQLSIESPKVDELRKARAKAEEEKRKREVPKF